jgi:hypothetical protein
LAAELATTKKIVSEEKAARLVANQSLAEERATWQIADQPLRASQEANFALNKDLLSTQASLTATQEKFSTKSSALDCIIIKECKAHIKLQELKRR